MKSTKIVSALFGVLFVLLLMGTAALGISARSNAPVMAGSLESAEVRTEALMEAICSRDYAAAEKLISGKPDLEPNREPATELSKVLWEAYGESMSYEFQSGCYFDDYGVYRDVKVTLLDIPALMEQLQSRSAMILSGKAVSNPAEAYDGNGGYRQEFIMKALAEAAEEMIREDSYLTTWDLTLQLTGRRGQWVVQQDHGLMSLIAGGIGGY